MFTFHTSQADLQCVNNIESSSAVATDGDHKAIINSFYRHIENLYNDLTPTNNVEDFASTINSDINIS